MSPIPDPGPVKKYKKRAETRECPVCSEMIPLRLLAAHAELESERVEAIIRRVGETDVDFELLDSLESLAETPTRPRLSALRARKSVSGSMVTEASTALLSETSQTIQAIKRHRKQRHAKLKELVRDDEVGSSSRVRETWRSRRDAGGEIVCPVCLITVRGDEDVLEAHVDACLADQTRRMEEARQAGIEEERRRREEEQDIDMGDLGEMVGPGHVGNVRGTGFHTRDPNSRDVDDEVDVDGDDEAVFGEAQFTEGDIVSALPPSQHIRPSDEDMDVDVDVGEDEGQTLHELLAEGKVIRRNKIEEQITEQGNSVEDTTPDEADKIDLAILSAKKRGDQVLLLGLLQSKIKNLESRSAATSLCRICIESYTDPTVSTGCWHTCCKECWLRCLGSTKLCPICKRITAATDLRRVYL
ncbi:hypothetical protein B0H10DRAFT_105984 [Mycena sp. CBHHK59/15]|nr:hypothetical protein B0H10DRAFT_105984 [Mycena sp. CBHHK59/15]